MPDTIDDAQEHPIIFNDWSIQRILAGEKTQTRRIVKGVGGGEGNGTLPVIQRPGDTYDDGKWYARTLKTRSNGWDSYDNFDALVAAHSPYGQPGDVLWVREGFRLAKRLNETSPKEAAIKDGMVEPPAPQVRYEADGCIITEADEWGRKRPSIHMPKELCRLRLRVEDVRVEQVQQISQEDAIAEGISGDYIHGEEDREYTDAPHVYGPKYGGSAITEFRRLWNDIHGDGAWERNDWVWVIEFARYDE